MADPETAPEPQAVDAEVVAPAADGYRPHLDGLRAVAVYLVVLFHAGLSSLTGGYIGVDVFFVLSGYLVTRLLLRDLVDGSVRFGRFYSRRFRRLLPAAFVTLIVTALVFEAVTPSGAEQAYGAFRAAFLYVSNWYFIRQSTNYFAGTVSTNPVLQFWSLAVEEQFYLVWPVALAGILWIARRSSTHRVAIVRATVAAGGLLSLAWALYLRTGDVNRAYFGTDARAYQLMAGASIALLPSLTGRLERVPRIVRIVALASVVGLVALATPLGGLDPILRGMAVTAVTCVALVALEHARGGAIKGALSIDPVTYLGKVSYGTYLWHWPVIILAGIELHLTPGAMAWFACLVATGMASLSYQLMERPVRLSPVLDQHRRVVVAAGLAISVLSAFVLIPAIISPTSASGSAPVASRTGFTPVPSWIDTGKIYYEGFGTPIVFGKGGTNPQGCVGQSPSACTVVHGTGLKILLMGDSNAEMMIPPLTTIAKENNFSLSLAVTAGCPWQRNWDSLAKDLVKVCRQRKEDAYRRVIPALDPDLIVLMNADVEDAHREDDPETAIDKTMEKTTRASLKALDNGRRRIVVIEPGPVSPPTMKKPLACLETARWLEDCRFVADPEPSRYEALTRSLAKADPRLRSADFDKLMCPYLPICDPVVNGAVVRWDDQHLTTRFAETLAPAILAYLRQNGLLST